MERAEIDLWWGRPPNPPGEYAQPGTGQGRHGPLPIDRSSSERPNAGTRKPRITPTCCCRPPSGARAGNDDQFERRVTFCPAFRRPPGKARPDGRSSAAVEPAAWFRASVHHTPSAARSMQEQYAQLSAGAFADGLRPQHGGYWPDNPAARSNEARSKGRAQRPKANNRPLPPDLLFPTANGLRLAFCAVLAVEGSWRASTDLLGGYYPCCTLNTSFWAFNPGPVAQRFDPARPRFLRLGGPCIPSLCWRSSGDRS